MSQYDIIRSCGHTETVSVSGPHWDRDAKLHRERQRLCRACWEREQQATSHRLASQAAEEGLPTLQGSPQQVRWAESIRHDLFQKLEDFEAQALSRIDNAGGIDQLHAVHRELAEAVFSALREIRAQDSAGWWIDHRDETPRQLVKVLVPRQSGPLSSA